MRTCIYCTLIFISAAAFGQDTNFATGPQYLITTGSPMFARPISTPTLSFSLAHRWRSAQTMRPLGSLRARKIRPSYCLPPPPHPR